MRILVAGDWHSQVHEQPVHDALKMLGHDVRAFSWNQYFRPGPAPIPLLRSMDALVRRIQNKFLLGPILGAINRDLLAAVREFHPAILFLYRGTHIARDTLRKIREAHPETALIGYNNDDPFSKKQPPWLWRHFLACVPEYDIVLAYRHHNLEDFKRIGARRVGLLRSWFVPGRHSPVALGPEDQARFACDVVFVGHYEADGRLQLLEEIARQGFRLRLFGPGYEWDPAIRKSPELRHLIPVRLIWGEDYNKALCGAKVALCFLSRLNRDSYTRRCFEIPATRTLLLSEYSDDLAGLYKEGVEADFFRSKGELVRKLRCYVEDDGLRRSVAEAGHRRVLGDGHDVVSRMKRLLETIGDCRAGLEQGNEGKGPAASSPWHGRY